MSRTERNLRIRRINQLKIIGRLTKRGTETYRGVLDEQLVRIKQEILELRAQNEQT